MLNMLKSSGHSQWSQSLALTLCKGESESHPDYQFYCMQTFFLSLQSQDAFNYHTSNSRECMGVYGKALQLQFKKAIFCTTTHARIRIRVLQVT